MEETPPARDEFSHELRIPANWASGVIVCSPHSGRDFPDWFLAETCLDIATLRSSEDAFIDDLIKPAFAAGAATLTARLPRSIVDLNRGASELDPDTVDCGRNRPTTPRALAGLGVIPRVVSGQRVIRNKTIPLAEAQRRIDTYWRPYHLALRDLIDRARSRFGWAVVIDMHSMPHDAVAHMLPPHPEMVIGDRHGISCSAVLRDRICAAFRSSGFRLRLNAPFSGAYIASAYGRPTQGVHVLQVEIDRALYLDATRMAPSDEYPRFARRLATVLEQVAVVRPDNGPVEVAAE
ncbi:MAG: N-formylglutamate amidohydrolase [Paracoccus denitrificans]|uniref:N-formylglutamate amidohydrolase n=1 Tax=Paracoccus denitrificans TaxID=266 RepID=A0A533I8H0_PARDE|nr:MAG: N-formylglutamate amidohydrolase [Paracoccus denitrificans]